MIKLKRVYDPAASADGPRFLVERLWPRGVKKNALQFEAWLKDVAPSAGLRQWFGHDPGKWREFRQRYFRELGEKPEAIDPIVEAVKHGSVTLLYSSHDTEHNNAVALKEYVERKLGDLGATTLEVSVEGHADSKFNCKVVFHDLEPLLRQKGHRLLSCETRQNGPNTPMSVRARTHAGVQLSRQKLKAKLRIIEHKDAHYTAKLVFVGLEEALAQQGILLEWIETREGGQRTPIAARVNIT